MAKEIKEATEMKLIKFDTVENITNGINQLILNAQSVGNRRMVSGLIRYQAKLLKNINRVNK